MLVLKTSEFSMPASRRQARELPQLLGGLARWPVGEPGRRACALDLAAEDLAARVAADGGRGGAGIQRTP